MSDENMNKWLKVHAQDSGKKIEDSAVFTAILTKNYIENPLCALQIGFAVLMDKPIVLIADKEMTMPLHLTKIAKIIEKVDIESEADMARAGQSIQNFLEEMGPKS